MRVSGTDDLLLFPFVAKLRGFFFERNEAADHKMTKYSRSELLKERLGKDKVKVTTQTIEETKNGKKSKIQIFYGEIVNEDGLLRLENDRKSETDLAD